MRPVSIVNVTTMIIIATLLSAAGEYMLSMDQAQQIIGEVRNAMTHGRKIAHQCGILTIHFYSKKLHINAFFAIFALIMQNLFAYIKKKL